MNADRSYRIILADDHALFLSGLQGLLSRRAECEVVGTAANGEKCLALMQESEHDVVLMDIDMPVLDGIRATERALALNPEEKIITLSMHGDDEFYFRMVEAGAKGFILKSADIDEVVTAIRTVCDGGTYFSQELLRNLVGKRQVHPGRTSGRRAFGQGERDTAADMQGNVQPGNRRQALHIETDGGQAPGQHSGEDRLSQHGQPSGLGHQERHSGDMTGMLRSPQAETAEGLPAETKPIPARTLFPRPLRP